MWGEAPVKFSEPRAGVGVRLRGSGGVCLGGTLLSDSGQPRGGEEPPSKGVYLEAVVGGGKQLPLPSFPSLPLPGVEGERSLWGSPHTP